MHSQRKRNPMSIRSQRPWEGGLATYEPPQLLHENMGAVRTGVLLRELRGCEGCGREGVPLECSRVAPFTFAALCERCAER